LSTISFNFIDIDDCASNLCQNGGSCRDGINGYTCDCEDGYIGENCETGELINVLVKVLVETVFEVKLNIYSKLRKELVEGLAFTPTHHPRPTSLLYLF